MDKYNNRDTDGNLLNWCTSTELGVAVRAIINNNYLKNLLLAKPSRGIVAEEFYLKIVKKFKSNRV